MTAAVAEPTIGCAEAEGAVLGCLLRLDVAPARRVIAWLEPEDFADPRMRLVFRAVGRCADDGVTPDPVTVLGEIRRTGGENSFVFDRQVGPFLLDVFAAGPVAANVKHYARIVLEHRVRRRLLEASERLAQISRMNSLPNAEAVASQEWADLFRHFERVIDCGGET